MDSAASVPSLTRRLGQAIRARRKSLRLTQIEVSQLAGCGPDFVYDAELGKTTLRLNKVLDLLQVLGLELVLEEGTETLRIGAALLLSSPSSPSPRSPMADSKPSGTSAKKRVSTKRARKPVARGSR